MFYPISYLTGATKIDSWIDIEGGIEIFANAFFEDNFLTYLFMLRVMQLTFKKWFILGHHIMVPKQGVAIHINAFNFYLGHARKNCC